MDKEELKTVFFGYDRKTVDIFLNKLHRMQEHELLELRRQVEKAKAERDKLNEEIWKLDEKIHETDVVSTQEPVADKVTEVDFTDEAKGARKVVALRGKPEKTIEEQHPVQQLQVEELVSVVVQQAELAMNEEAAASSEEREAAVSQGAGKQEAAARQSYDEQQVAVKHGSEMQEAAVVQRSEDQIAAAIQGSGKQEAAAGQGSEEKAAQAIKAEISQSEISLSEPVIQQEPLQPDVHIDEAISEPVRAIQRKPKLAVGLGFWEDADRYLGEDEEYLIPTYEVSAASEAAIPASKPTSEWNSPPADKPLQQAPIPPIVPQQIQKETIESEVAAAAEKGHLQESSPEIEALKRSYIIGKTAGEDLHDRKGQLISAKGAVITAEIVKRAESAGKLAELIVHMAIPGLED